jgi:hypothetical protein
MDDGQASEQIATQHRRLAVAAAGLLFLGLLAAIFVSNRRDEPVTPPTSATTSSAVVATPEEQAARYLEQTCVGPAPIHALYVGPATDGHGRVGGWFFKVTTDTGYSYGVMSVTLLPNGSMFTACHP